MGTKQISEDHLLGEHRVGRLLHLEPVGLVRNDDELSTNLQQSRQNMSYP